MMLAALFIVVVVGVAVLAGLAVLFMLSSLAETCRYYDEQ